jgi:hypothetical protein
MTTFRDRYLEWTHRVEFTFLGFYTEHWRSPEDDPDYERLVEKYGDEASHRLERTQLLDEVLAAAAGLLYTVDKIERLLGELQTDVDEYVPRWSQGEPWPELGSKVSHPHALQASFEFVNLLGWLRAIDERLDRPHRPGRKQPRIGLLPALADRPLRTRVEHLVKDFRTKVLERTLANYVLHAGVVPSPLGGVRLTQTHEISLRIPDRPTNRVDHWLLTYQDERDALTLARETGRDVELLIENLLTAFDHERRAIDDERERSRPLPPPSPPPF